MQGGGAHQSQDIRLNGAGEHLVVLAQSPLIQFGRRQIVLNDQNRTGWSQHERLSPKNSIKSTTDFRHVATRRINILIWAV
jgi:hypothetical protein